jgi:hypothetical protein
MTCDNSKINQEPSVKYVNKDQQTNSILTYPLSKQALQDHRKGVQQNLKFNDSNFK